MLGNDVSRDSIDLGEGIAHAPEERGFVAVDGVVEGGWNIVGNHEWCIGFCNYSVRKVLQKKNKRKKKQDINGNRTHAHELKKTKIN